MVYEASQPLMLRVSALLLKVSKIAFVKLF